MKDQQRVIGKTKSGEMRKGRYTLSPNKKHQVRFDDGKKRLFRSLNWICPIPEDWNGDIEDPEFRAMAQEHLKVITVSKEKNSYLQL